MTDDEGRELRGTLHPDWGKSVGPVRGATADLAKAFRQIALVPAHAPFSVISIYN